jgi:hypothetical protein
MCLACGFYKGREVLNLAADAKKRDARIKAKRERIRAVEESPEPTEAHHEVSEPVPDTSGTPSGETEHDKRPEKKLE